VEEKIDEVDRKIKEWAEKVENIERGKNYNAVEEEERSGESKGGRRGQAGEAVAVTEDRGRQIIAKIDLA